jgi:hypothetical protein
MARHHLGDAEARPPLRFEETDAYSNDPAYRNGRAA